MQIITGDLYDEHKKDLYDALFSLTQGLIQDYPGYQNWFYGTFIEGLKKNERIYLVVQEGNQIIGCAFLKNTPDEKKISTLYIVPAYRKKGIGHLLMEKSVKLLGTGTIVSVSDQNLVGLCFLLKKFNFQHIHQIKSLYLKNVTEHFYIKK